MSVIRDPDRKTWRVYIRYKDWQGKPQIHTKRGFATKREAREYERAFLQKQSRDINMSFADFADTYMSDMKPRLKLNTYSLFSDKSFRAHISTPIATEIRNRLLFGPPMSGDIDKV